MIDFRLLTFLELCEQRNYTKTALKLNITQPTVTQHIQYLEQQYGVKLFQYEGKKLHLTKEGNLLLQATLTMQTDSIKVAQRMKQCQKGQEVRKIGATLTIGEFVLPHVLERYLLNHPNVELSMIVGNTSYLLEELKAGRIEIAFVEGYFDKEEFDYQLWKMDEFIGICSSKASLSYEKHRLDELLEYPIIIREKGSGTREIFERVLYERGLSVERFHRKIEIGNLNVIKQMVMKDLGISFMYRSAVEKELKQGTICELKLKDFQAFHEYNFVSLKNSFFSKEYNQFFKGIAGE